MATATLGPVEISVTFRAQTTGGMRVPEKTVDRGFDFASYNQRKPIELTFEAMVTSDELSALQGLRDGAGEPFSASVGSFEIAKAVLPDLQVEETADRKSHVRVSGTVREVFQAGIETTEFVIPVPSGGGQSGSSSGDGGGGGGGGGGSSTPPLVESNGDSTGETSASSGDEIDTVGEMRQVTPGPWV